jgi:hypothetical protein
VKRFVPALFSLFLLAPLSALAQPAGFVRGFGGVSFLTEPGAAFGATLGLRINDGIDIVGDFGRLTNILPRRIQRDLDAAAQQFGSFFGAPVSIDLKAPGLYAFGGLRVTRAAGAHMRVYLEGGGGVARGTSRIEARAGAVDVSDEVIAILRLKPSETRPLVALGVGVSVPIATRVTADVGYRFLRILTDDPRINTGTMTAGVAWGF